MGWDTIRSRFQSLDRYVAGEIVEIADLLSEAKACYERETGTGHGKRNFACVRTFAEIVAEKIDRSTATVYRLLKISGLDPDTRRIVQDGQLSLATLLELAGEKQADKRAEAAAALVSGGRSAMVTVLQRTERDIAPLPPPAPAIAEVKSTSEPKTELVAKAGPVPTSIVSSVFPPANNGTAAEARIIESHVVRTGSGAVSLLANNGVAVETAIIEGDNLAILKSMLENTADLIYLDPPFNSGRDYALQAEARGSRELAYCDTWRWDDDVRQTFDELTTDKKLGALLRAFEGVLGEGGALAHLTMLAPRLLELHRVLKPTGSLYLHCDPSASACLRLLLDGLFGPRRFISEIVWRRTSSHNNARRPGPIHDTLLYYSKSPSYTWNPSSHLSGDCGAYDGFDAEGRRWVEHDLTGPEACGGHSGLPWRGYDPGANSRHWAIPGRLGDEYERLTGETLVGTTQDKLDMLDEVGLVVPPSGRGLPKYKLFADEKGVLLQDIWDDIPRVTRNSGESVGFDGQKPLAMLERIIKCSSNEGDIVLDPFLGSGTTVVAAERLGRRWLGIELNPMTVAIARRRLAEMRG